MFYTIHENFGLSSGMSSWSAQQSNG